MSKAGRVRPTIYGREVGSGGVEGVVMAKTVMVVEDDALIRDMVIQVLAWEGFTAIGASNGEDALHQLREEHLHLALILLDLMMPVMT